ncbi:unnamed protein product [Mucor hiemalis]
MPNQSSKPCLDRLKGSFELKHEQRRELDISKGLFDIRVKDWSNVKKVVDAYLKDTTEIKEDTPVDFYNLLIETLEKIEAESVEDNVLLSDYCKRLIVFFKHGSISKKIKQYYLHQFTIYRVGMNQRTLALQSRSTALVATTEESLNLEDEMIAHIGNPGKKRPFKETTDEIIIQEEHEGVIEETSVILDESFDSVEKHPRVRSYYNYFVGDRKERWTLEESYRAAKMMLDLSDERVLSLSFIFLINEKDSNEGFINLIKEEDDEVRTSLPIVSRLPTNEKGMMMAYKIDECNGDMQQIKRRLAELHNQHWNPEEEATVYFDIINAFSNQVKKINDTHTEQDHDSYEILSKMFLIMKSIRNTTSQACF